MERETWRHMHMLARGIEILLLASKAEGTSRSSLKMSSSWLSAEHGIFQSWVVDVGSTCDTDLALLKEGIAVQAAVDVAGS
jgi:hypothetical protein